MDLRLSYETELSSQHSVYFDSRYVNMLTQTKMQILDENEENFEPNLIKFVDDPFNHLIIRDAYIESMWSDSVSTRIGQQRIVWGQFDVFSQ